MEAQGFDTRKTLECLMRNDCNYITATYFLMAEGRAAAGSFSATQQKVEGLVMAKDSSSGGSADTTGAGHQHVTGAAKWGVMDDSAVAMHQQPAAAVPTWNPTIAAAG